MDPIAVDADPAASRVVAESPATRNARDLERELAWFTSVLNARFNLFMGREAEVADVAALRPPDLQDADSHFGRFLRHYRLSFAERVALGLALAPHVRPRLLDVFFIKNKRFGRPHTEFGGLWHGADGGFTPTFETLAFIMGPDDLATRFSLLALFDRDHYFARHDILRLVPKDPDGPVMKAPLRLSDEILGLFTAGRAPKPDAGVGFPARCIETKLEWDDLVLHPGVRTQIEEIKTWIHHGETLMGDWGMATKLRPGYRALFYGPPGTGKTMTACLLGKTSGREVYKVDLSLVVSKYIGETEKNLARVFDRAQHKDWILFFDEADALFGKRSETRDAHDRYANQEVAYLLQRIESFDGIVILASNLRENLDPAFTRRFEAMIYFPMPQAEERLRLWRQGFSPVAQLASDLDLARLAREHALSGGAIMNVIRYASLQALRAGGPAITRDDVLRGIRKENAKEGKGG